MNKTSPYPVGTIVVHKRRPEFGYGIIVFSFPELLEAVAEDMNIGEDAVAVVLWHGDDEKELTETPQLHTYSELKILNTTVGFA